MLEVRERSVVMVMSAILSSSTSILCCRTPLLPLTSVEYMYWYNYTICCVPSVRAVKTVQCNDSMQWRSAGDGARRWLWAVGCLRAVDRLYGCGLVDNVVRLWISKGKTRVRALYPKSYPPKERMFFAQEMLCLIPFSTISQIKKWKPFSSKKTW